VNDKISAEKVATPFSLGISEQKRMEDAFSESEQFRCLVENAAVPICIINLRGRFTYMNSAMADLLGYSVKELLGRSFTDFLHSGDKGKIMRLFIRIIGLRRSPRNLEFRVIRKDGRVLHLMSKPTRFEINGKTVGFQAIIVDITERKQMEEVLSKSESKFRNIFENADDCMIFLDNSGRILDVNKKGVEIFGGTKQELLGKHFTKVKVVSLGDVPKILGGFAKTLSGKKAYLTVHIKNLKGEEIDLECSGSLTKINDKLTALIIARDISERKKVQEALNESEEKYRSIVELAPDGIVTADMKGVVTSVNTAFSRLTGFSKDEIVGKHFTRLGTLRARGASQFLKLFSSLLKGKIPPPFESLYNRKDGTSGWAEVHVSLLEVDGKKTGFQAIIREITARKKAERELLRLSSAVKMSADSIVIADLDAKIIDVNEVTLEMYGTKDKRDLIGKSSFDLIAPEDREKALADMKEVLEKGYIKDREYNIIVMDGSKTPVEMNTAIMKDADGRPIGFVGISRDITERKKAEDALKKSENKSRLLLENLPQKIFFKDRNSVYISCNKNYARDLKINPDQITGKTDYDFYPKQLAEKYREDDRRIIGSGKTEDIEEKYVQNGHKVFVQTVKTPIKDENDNVVGILGIFWDITERKNAEEQAKSLSEFQKKVIDTAVVWIDLLDAESNVTLWNRAAELISGYSREEVIGHKKIWEWLYPDPKYREEVFGKARAIIEKGESQENLQTTIRCKDGTLKTISWYSNNILDEKGPIGSIAVGTDVTEIKKAQEKIAESEEKYRNLFDNARDTIITFDLKGNLTSVNKVVEEYGFKRSEMIGKNMLTFVSREYWPKLLRQLADMVRGNTVEGEIEILTPKGKEIVEYRSNPIKEDEKVVGLQTIMRNITERRNMEDNLRESEEKYRSLVELAPDVIITLNLKGAITSCNVVTARASSYSKDEIVGKHFSKLGFLRIKDIPKYVKMLSSIIKGKVPEPFEAAWRAKDGTEHVDEVRLGLMKKDDKIIGIQAITRDITERKQMEEKLRQYSEHLEELVRKRTDELLESEKRYAVLVEEASDGVAIAQDGKMVFANRRAAEIFGYPRDELVGLPFEKPVDEKYRQLVVERYTRRLRGEKVPATYEVEVVAKNGERKPIELSATRIDYQGRSANLLLIRDISERKRMEEQRLRLEKLATMGELATMVAHDLRNPLTSIRNATYYIKSTCPYKKDAECKTAIEMFDIIEQETIFANNIINDLLDFSAKRPLQKTSQNINEIILASLAKSIVQKNINIEMHFAKEATATVDKRQLERVFLNLIKNAMQAMPNGGKLTLTTKETKDFVEIVFSDTGVGISEENMSKLFAPLFTTKAKGIGMGLAICKKIVEEHEGTISVKSKVGEGTSFTIKLSKEGRGDDQ
jgi:PAS domain S-box-containing protein